MFDVLFYLCMFSYMIVDNTLFKEEQVQQFGENESNLSLEKGK
jgi:hypothetical protein